MPRRDIILKSFQSSLFILICGFLSLPTLKDNFDNLTGTVETDFAKVTIHLYARVHASYPKIKQLTKLKTKY